MAPNDLHLALLRPPILHILRAQGFQAARPAAVDALVDIAARYLLLLARQTAAAAWSNHNGPEPDVTDARMALEAVGLLAPAHGAMEDQFADDDDLRGVDGFVEWVRGDANREVMRIAGLVGTESQAAGLEGEREDYLAVLKKKHSKTGEEARFQGTVLGKPAEERPAKIDGDNNATIRGWESRLRVVRTAPSTPLSHHMTSPSAMTSPLTDM